MKKFFSLLVIFILMLSLTGCGSEKNLGITFEDNKNLGITAEEFQLAFNQEFENLCNQNSAEISNFKVMVEPEKYFKIAGIDRSSGSFKLGSINPYFKLGFEIDETSSEKYLNLVTLEINEQIYRNVIGNDSAEKMKVADIVKKSFAKAATQKKSSPEKIDEVEKAGIRGQTERLLKDNGLEFLYFAYNPGGKYFIASEDYAKTSEDFAQGEKAIEVAAGVSEQEKVAQQKAKEQEKNSLGVTPEEFVRKFNSNLDGNGTMVVKKIDYKDNGDIAFRFNNDSTIFGGRKNGVNLGYIIIYSTIDNRTSIGLAAILSIKEIINVDGERAADIYGELAQKRELNFDNIKMTLTKNDNKILIEIVDRNFEKELN